MFSELISSLNSYIKERESICKRAEMLPTLAGIQTVYFCLNNVAQRHGNCVLMNDLETKFQADRCAAPQETCTEQQTQHEV